MPTISNETNVDTQLRDKAEAKLQAGTAPTALQWSVSVDALSLLHRLSSNPDNAADALKLLHELQVHQVELDLQNEEIAANEQALVDDLTLYRELYDAAPFGYLLVDLEGKVVQGNLAAAELLGIGRDDLVGHPVSTHLLPESRPLLFGLLQHVAQSGTGDCCVAELAGSAQGSRHLRFLASIPPGSAHILLACCEHTSVNSP
ncbi:PAS domain-containing protein [Halomonas campisalis]|uniref:PAS domain-containing protein n=1 Tax=Billgrantia campisalis TaxID=74661 RepID=A0ABS9P765_9GAMM|nr:PAS domain-containing protein [Halomonas campisalis]MCG6657618.1 PAS domain-containing protein [Halomonas campisalis]MDR5862610.1 PAS domain-containing protein [Halomonas campisalis]